MKTKSTKKKEVEISVLPEINEDNTKIGFITNCEKLYIRKDPEFASEVMGIGKKNEIVIVDMAASTEYFYRVTTECGLDGYCRKEFVEFK